MPWNSGTTGSLKTWTFADSVTSYGWQNLKPSIGSSSLDIGVDFIIVADDDHAVLAFDNFRGTTASDTTRKQPP